MERFRRAQGLRIIVRDLRWLLLRRRDRRGLVGHCRSVLSRLTGRWFCAQHAPLASALTDLNRAGGLAAE